MKQSPSDSSAILDPILDVLWRQWCAIGLKGYGEKHASSVVDLEALVLATCMFGRYDARLFDGMIEWLEKHGRYFNPQRARTLVSANHYAGADILATISNIISTSQSSLKWKKTAQKVQTTDRKPLFLQRDGSPLPISRPDKQFAESGFLRDTYVSRGIIGNIETTSAATLSIRLRAFIGVGARAEILVYLLQSRDGSPREMARRLGFSPAAVGYALQEMSDSGILSRRESGRRLVYWLTDKDALQKLLGLAWVPPLFPWSIVFAVFEAVFSTSQFNLTSETDVLKASSSLRSRLRLLDLEYLSECTEHTPANLQGAEYLAHWVGFVKHLPCRP